MIKSQQIESLLTWEDPPQYGTEEYLDGVQMKEAASLVGATYVAAHFYGDCNAPYPAFERDGKVAYLSTRVGDPGLEPIILEILNK